MATTRKPSSLATQIALDFRMQFRRDVVIDVVCFHKLGHNEQDTPALTQRMMYKEWRSIRAYATCMRPNWRLRESSLAAADQMAIDFRSLMDSGVHPTDPAITNFKNQSSVMGAVPQPQMDRRC